jgi:hypothetical protein
MQDRYRQLDEILLRRTAGPYIRVKRRNPQIEPKSSAVHPIADIRRWSPDFRFVPISDIRTAAEKLAIRSRRRRERAAWAAL